jgi:DNA-binding NarL/FixJ family response regulator
MRDLTDAAGARLDDSIHMSSEAEPKPTRVLLLDRPGFGRRALAVLLEALPGVSLVAEAGDAAELEAALRTQPDVVIVDDRLLEQARAVQGGLPFPLIVMGVDDDPGFAARAQRAGAMAWVAKDQADATLPGLLSAMPVLTPL